MDIRLHDIERAVRFFQKETSRRSKEERKKLRWLWKKLPWSARMLGHMGIQEQTWWYRRYVLPVLSQAADLHLRRFLLGDFREVEEKTLSLLFSFFSREALHNPNLFSQEITEFLLGEAPSFSKERKMIQSLLSEKKKGYGSFSWYKDELFSQYQRRMHALHKRGAFVCEQAEKSEAPEVQDPVKPATKKRVKQFLTEIRELKEKIESFYETCRESCSKIFPLRFEIDQMVSSIQEVESYAFDLMLTLDELSYWVAEVVMDKECRHRLKEAKEVVKKVLDSFDTLRSWEESLKKRGQEEGSHLQKSLQGLSRKIDKIPSLASSGALKQQQASILKKARARVKEFRIALGKGPGPNISFKEMKQEIEHLSEVARGLYDEGVEIERMRKELQTLRERVAEKGDSAGILSHIENLLNSLEVTSNRKRAFAKIQEEVQALQ